MSTRDVLRGVAVLVAIAGCATARTLGPDLGQTVSAAEVARWDISIAPDGAGLPAGSGTPAKGEAVYAAKCQQCHGAKGAGQPNDRLVGGQGTLASATPVRTIGSYWPYATTVFDYVRRAMPYPQPRSLTDDEVYAVTAYLLHLNDIIGLEDEMNAQTLPRVRMPNRDNFILAYPRKAN
jgi:S-disulfanyl-L-cysteine oxidoreductase SoxD